MKRLLAVSPSHQVLQLALARLLRPLVRVLLRHGIAFSDFAELARAAYVDVAHSEFPPPGRKQSLSNVAVITGLHRHEVKRLLALRQVHPSSAPKHNRAARVIHGWLSDPRFSDDGVARIIDADEHFKTLVATYSGDITPRPILDELIRVGAVIRQGDQLKLVVDAYVPFASDEDMIRIFGECVSDLINTVNHNLTHVRDQQRLQISVVHDNLPDDVLEQLELVSRDRSMTFLREMNEFFATQDRDSNPNVKGDGRNRAGIGLYFFKDSLDEEA